MRSLLLFLALLLPVQGTAQVLTGKTVWSGAVELSGKVRVEKGAELIVKPGTEVRFRGGSLEVAGVLKVDRAQFSGQNWQGIILKGCDASTLLRTTSITGAKIGVQVIGGQPRLENNHIVANRVGVELRQKSAATVTGNRFEANDKVGLFVKDGASASISDNIFSGHEQYAAYVYRAKPQIFTGNSFTQNATGLIVSFSGSNPKLLANRFSGNRVGIRVERAARPEIVGNTLSDNEIGIDLYRRADPLIRGNLFEKNKKGVTIAYSSYPLITRNDFLGNGLAIYLEFQSAVWEGAQGGVERESETARRSAFGGQNKAVAASAPPAYLDGTVHAPENFWGQEGTAELQKTGRDTNPGFIDDGRDRPTFIDGGESYPLDRVDFVPWQNRPLTDTEDRK